MGQKIVRLPRRVITFVAAGGLATAGAAALATGWTASAAQSDPLVVWVCKYVGQKDHQVLQDGSPISINWAALVGKTPPEVGDTFSDAQSKSVVVQVGGTDPGSVACLDVTPPTTTTTEPTTTEPTTTEPTTTEPTTAAPTTTEPTTAAPTTTVPGDSGAGDGDGDGVPSVPVTTTVPPSTVPTTTAPTTKTPATTLPTTVAPTTSTAVPTTTAPATTAVVAPPHGSNGGGTTGVVPGVGAPHTGGGGQVSSGNRLLGSSLLAGGLALAAGEALRRRRENAAR